MICTFGKLFVAQNQAAKKKYSGRLLISASATVGALLLVALMCFWGCFLYKKFGKHDSKSFVMDVGRGATLDIFFSFFHMLVHLFKLTDSVLF